MIISSTMIVIFILIYVLNDKYDWSNVLPLICIIMHKVHLLPLLIMHYLLNVRYNYIFHFWLKTPKTKINTKLIFFIYNCINFQKKLYDNTWINKVKSN